jgi:hypothetical protein
MRPQVSRRSFLGKTAIGAGGLLIFAVGGMTWRAWDRGSLGNLYEGPAFEPWNDWTSRRYKGALGVVSAAILASNPHNSQPWLFRVQTRLIGQEWEQQIELFADMTRGLRSIDPFLREMHIGLGCALENMMIAARGKGFTPALTIFPNKSDLSLIARVGLRPGATAADAHFNIIGERRTNRSSYDRSRDLAPAALDGFQRQVKHHDTLLKLFTAASPEGRLFADGTVEATTRFIADHEMLRDNRCSAR